MLFKIWMISISLSIDALGIGMTYRLKGIKIPVYAKVIVGLLVGGVSFGALFIGRKIVSYFPEDVLKIVVTALLSLMGILFIRKGLYATEMLCDINASETIEADEAILLGIGLSLDSVGTGIAVAALGIHHILLPILIGLHHALFLWGGEWIGEKTRCLAGNSERICSVFSGVLLVLLAVLHGIG